MGIVGTHPGSFRKSDNQRGCRIRNLEEHTEDKRGAKWKWRSRRERGARKERGSWLKDVTPVFFVSVAFKGFSFSVSLLFAALAGEP
jgi:hypothetical protein